MIQWVLSIPNHGSSVLSVFHSQAIGKDTSVALTIWFQEIISRVSKARQQHSQAVSIKALKPKTIWLFTWVQNGYRLIATWAPNTIPVTIYQIVGGLNGSWGNFHIWWSCMHAYAAYKFTPPHIMMKACFKRKTVSPNKFSHIVSLMVSIIHA